MKAIIKTTLAVVLTIITIQLSAQKSTDTKTVVYECSFDCPSCETKVMKNLPYEKGVKDVSVNYEQKLVTVEYKTSKNNDQNLAKALEKMGYEVDLKGQVQSFGVNGNCGMCKDKIETAAKSIEGVSTADWNQEQKHLNVVFDNATVNINDIQKAIAAVGYDTDLHKANDEVYNNLHSCCKYDR